MTADPMLCKKKKKKAVRSNQRITIKVQTCRASVRPPVAKSNPIRQFLRIRCWAGCEPKKKGATQYSDILECKAPVPGLRSEQQTCDRQSHQLHSWKMPERVIKLCRLPQRGPRFYSPVSAFVIVTSWTVNLYIQSQAGEICVPKHYYALLVTNPHAKCTTIEWKLGHKTTLM